MALSWFSPWGGFISPIKHLQFRPGKLEVSIPPRPLCTQFSTGCQLTPFSNHPRGGVVKGHTTISGEDRVQMLPVRDSALHSTNLFLLITNLPSFLPQPLAQTSSPLLNYSLSLSFRYVPVLLPSPSGLFTFHCFPSFTIPSSVRRNPDPSGGFVLPLFSTVPASPSL